MKQLDSNIEPYQEGTQVPSIAWKVILRIPEISDTETLLNDVDVSERLMNEPNITDTADYRENLTYTNEIGIKLNNEDKYLTNDAGTGILDTDEPIKVTLQGYFDIETGSSYPINKFTGWLDRGRMKVDPVKMNCEALAYSTFGKSERVTALNVTKRYLDENGLRLYTAKVWVRDANITGYELQKGVHYITTFFDTNPKAKLDDGPETILTADAETVLSNADDTQRVKIFYTGFDHADERVSTLIVKNISQYPETYFYYGTVAEIVRKCFESIGVTDTVIQSYEIDTHDGRQILSGLNRVDNTLESFIPVAIEFNGINKFYISGANTGSPNKNQIWEFDKSTGIIRLIYETTLNNNTHYKLVYDENEELLLAFMDSPEFDTPGCIQKITINESGASWTSILNDSQFDLVNSYYRFHYSKYLTKFLFLGLNGANKVIYDLDLYGTKTVIATDSNLELNGCSFIYESGSEVVFYYIKNVSGTHKLFKRTYSGGWTEALVETWFDAGDYNNWYGYKFVGEEKVFLTNRNKSRFLDINTETFTADLNPAGVEIYSPFESDGKLFVMTYDSGDDIQRLASFQSDTLSYECENILPYDIIKTPVAYGFQHICTYYANELAVLSKYPALMLRFANKFVPFIEGEYDTLGKTIREVLQEISNNFLGYVKVNAEDVGYYVSRDNYDSGDTLTFNKNYNKERLTERIYNEVFDRVEITNGRTSSEFGENGIDVRIKSLELAFLPDGFLKDYAKYFLDYYSTRRKIVKIKYLPTFYNYENLDQADLSSFGLGTGKIHKVSPKKSVCEFEILI